MKTFTILAVFLATLVAAAPVPGAEERAVDTPEILWVHVDNVPCDIETNV